MMKIFKVSMERIQGYDFIIEADDEDEALEVANEAIDDIDSWNLEDDGWDANSQELDDTSISKREIALAIKEHRFINREDFFS